MYHLDSGNKNGGCVAIYTQNTFRHSIINHLTNAIDDVLECISVDVLLHKENIATSCIHKHPTCPIDEFVGNVAEIYIHKQCAIYICADININILNQASNVTNVFNNVFIAYVCCH